MAYTALGSLVSSCVFDLDATQNNSYAGSGTTWANLEATPADGSAQTAYDFQTGDGATSTTYPTHTGTPDTAAAYWLFDGGDYFQQKNGMTAFLQNLHKTTGGQAHWFAAAGQLSTSLSIQEIFATGTSGNVHGIHYRWRDNESFFSQQAGAGTVNALTGESGFLSTFEYLVVGSYDPATSTFRYWVNGVRYPDITITPSTSTTNSTQCRIGATVGTTPVLFLTNGHRLYAASAGNVLLGDSDEALIRAEYETRHARSYTRVQTELAALVSSAGVCMELDAHVVASVFKNNVFNSDWSNICTSPADGSAQTAYDMPDVSAPPFINLGGADGAYWNPANGDYWKIAANTQLLKDLHKTTGGADFWAIIIVNIADGSFASSHAFFSTSSADNSVTAGADGLAVLTSTNENMFAAQAGTLAGSSAASDFLSAGALAATGWRFFAVSYSHSGNNWRFWHNSTTSSSISHTFAASILDATGVFTLGATTDGSPNFGAELDWKHFSFGNIYLTDSKLAELLYALEVRHGRDYDGDAIIGDPGGGGIDGTASITQAADTLSSTATLAIKGVASVTQADQSTAITGALSIKGTASMTQSDEAVSSTGILQIKAVVDLASESDTLTAAAVFLSNLIEFVIPFRRRRR